MNHLIELRNTQQERNFWKQKYLNSESVKTINDLLKIIDDRDEEIKRLERRLYKLELVSLTKLYTKGGNPS